MAFIYAKEATPVASSTLATHSFSSSASQLLEVHGDGSGNFEIRQSGTSLGGISSGPDGLTSANARLQLELDCPTAPDAKAELGISQLLIYARHY